MVTWTQRQELLLKYFLELRESQLRELRVLDIVTIHTTTVLIRTLGMRFAKSFILIHRENLTSQLLTQSKVALAGKCYSELFQFTFIFAVLKQFTNSLCYFPAGNEVVKFIHTSHLVPHRCQYSYTSWSYDIMENNQTKLIHSATCIKLLMQIVFAQRDDESNKGRISDNQHNDSTEI